MTEDGEAKEARFLGIMVEDVAEGSTTTKDSAGIVVWPCSLEIEEVKLVLREMDFNDKRFFRFRRYDGDESNDDDDDNERFGSDSCLNNPVTWGWVVSEYLRGRWWLTPP